MLALGVNLLFNWDAEFKAHSVPLKIAIQTTMKFAPNGSRKI